MAKLKSELHSWSRREPRLTAEEFASLKEVGNRPMQRTMSDERRERLIRAGYIREVVAHSGGVSALALTGRGLRRLEKSKRLALPIRSVENLDQSQKSESPAATRAVDGTF